MPGPGFYVLVVVGTVAAGFAFKEFVYEPHIAPKVERWAENFIAKRKAKRRQKEGLVSAQPVCSPGAKKSAKNSNFSDTDPDAEDPCQPSKHSYELENLVAKELREWREEVSSQELRHRKLPNAGSSRVLSGKAKCALDESVTAIPYIPITPTHVIVDSSLPSTPTSTIECNTGSSDGLSSPGLLPRSSEMRSLNESPIIVHLPLSPVAHDADLLSRSSPPFPSVYHSRSIDHSAISSEALRNDIVEHRTSINSSSSSKSGSPVVRSFTPSPCSSAFASPFEVPQSLPLSPTLLTFEVVNGPSNPPTATASPTSPFYPSLPLATNLSQGQLNSRPSSSLSFLSEANTTFSTHSNLSFSHSDAVDSDDVISVSPGSVV